jgi:hypothetical protein
MHSWIKRVGLLLTLSLCSGGSAIAEDKAGEINIDLAIAAAIKEVNQSPEFHKMVECIGATEPKMNQFFVQFHENYRSCLTKFPFKADGGKGFLGCWEKELSSMFGGLSTDKALLKKCGVQ